MTLTIRFLNEMLRIWGDSIDKPFEQYLLAMYEEEPFPYEWSEQDLYEQIRKLILKYNRGEIDISIPSTEERQRDRYEALKDSYLELLQETNHLRSIIKNTRAILDNDCKASLDDGIF